MKILEKEFEIRELENRLAELKNGLRKQNALEHIKKTAEERDNAIIKQIEDLKYQYSVLYTELSSLEPRVADLLEIAKTLYENKLFSKKYKGNSSRFSFTNHYAYDKSCDGIRVSLGYDWDYDWVYMGHYNTEVNGDEINIITHYSQNVLDKGWTNKTQNDNTAKYVIKALQSSINAMTYFLEQFDKFEDSVYEFVNNL